MAKTERVSTSNKPWYRKARWWVLAVAAVLVLAVLLGLQPLVRYETRQTFGKLKGYHGDFSDAHLSLIPLRYDIWHVKLTRDNAEAWEPPEIYAKHASVQLDIKQLFKRHLVVEVKALGGKLALVAKPERKHPEKATISLGTQLQKMAPVDVNRVEARDCEVLYVLGDQKGSPELWLHHIEATVENLATRANLSEGTTTVAVSATLQKSGELSAFVTADPLQKQFTFSGQVQLKGLEMTDMYALMDSKTDLKISRGTLDMFARFDAKDGNITGGVKPVLKNAKVETNSSNIFDKLKAKLADAALNLFADRVPGRNAVATVIPIQGTVNNPKLELWPTILGVVRNAFVQGLTESFRNTPPPKAATPEGPLTQARRALSKDGGVPKAQPTK